MRGHGVTGVAIIGGFAIGRCVSPIGQTILLAGVNIAADFLIIATGEGCRHRSRTDQNQRDMRAGFANFFKHRRSFKKTNTTMILQYYANKF